MPADPRRAQEVFLAAVATTDVGGRSALLERECGGDRQLRDRVIALLRAHELPDNALDTPALDPASWPRYIDRSSDRTRIDDTWAEDTELAPGAVIDGRYRLIELLGQGGMGSVYRAEQIAPMRRTVAIKVIRGVGLGVGNTKTMLARFASERQALALMDHPNIARILDAGVIESPAPRRGSPATEPLKSLSQTLASAGRSSDRPYFVMDLVDGLPLNKYVLGERLTVRQRVELFVPVCAAVQHAHQKGVIHRDLKPGNVLVTAREGQAVPVVIDFGIAKSTGDRLGDLTFDTHHGQWMGTLDYMPPEQATHGAASVDTRADVYALGAMLYELLTGDVPFGRDRLRAASVIELGRMLREEEPVPLPKQVTNDPATAAAAGLGDVAPLRRELAGDLEWIVVRCLEKDCERRYPSAGALADDLRRYLAGAAVEAGPPTRSYQARKFIRRHRTAVFMTALVGLALVGGLAGVGWGMVQAQRAAASAHAELGVKEVARAEEARLRHLAETERTRADSEAAVARAVLHFLQTDVLRQADTATQAAGDADPNLTVRSALDRAGAAIDRRFTDQPLVEAAIRRTIGDVFDGLGEFVKGIHHLNRSVALYEQHLGADHESTMDARYDLADALRHAGRFDEAARLTERVVAFRLDKFGPDHKKTLAAQTLLGIIYDKVGRGQDTRRIFAEICERMQTSQADPLSVIAAEHNLANIEANQGLVHDAIRRMEGLTDRLTKLRGSDSPQRLELLLSLGQLYSRARRTADAVATLAEARAFAARRLSPEHPRLLMAAFLLADAHCRNGNIAEAGRVLEEARAKCLDKVGPNHIRFHAVTIELARWAAETGQLERADELIAGTLQVISPLGNAAGLSRALAQGVEARTHLLEGRPTEAEPLARQSLAGIAARRSEDWLHGDARILLGLCLVAQGRHDEAEPLLNAGQAHMIRLKAQLSWAGQKHLAEGLAALARGADARHQPDAAKSWRDLADQHRP